MSEALYERYKDALRRGHVAALRGRFEEALKAYRDAASIATERPLPYTSLGGIHLRLGDVDGALEAYAAALERAPRDEAALLGRGEALIRAERRAEAAVALDLASEIQDAAGRRTEALDTARRALEIAESKARRRHLEGLIRALRETGPDREAEVVLARAMHVLETPEPEEPEPEPEVLVAEDTAPDPIALMVAADAALDAGEETRARDDLLAAARAHGAAGGHDAALDACYRALAIAPDDPEIHLELVDLYLARGWRELAAEKLALLSRLVELDDDPATGERIRAIAAASLPDDPGPAGLRV